MKNDHPPGELLSHEESNVWDQFFALREETPESEKADFLAERDLRSPERKDPLSDE